MCPRCPGRYTSHDAVFGLAPDPGAKRLYSDAECDKNIGEELHAHFNYEGDNLPGRMLLMEWVGVPPPPSRTARGRAEPMMVYMEAAQSNAVATSIG